MMSQYYFPNSFKTLIILFVKKKNQLDDAKALYNASSLSKKTIFAFEHCWVMLKNQPKWSVSKERSKGLPQTPSSIDQVGSNDNDTMVLERPIG